MTHLLDNIFWATLDGMHRHLSSGTGKARRYAPGFSPIVAFPVAEEPDFAALLPFVEPGERFYCDAWSGPAQGGWRIEAEATMYRMVRDGAKPARDTAPDAIRLGPGHVEQALALAKLTKPGPFGPRTIEMGEYFGYFEDRELVAMAGERMAGCGWSPRLRTRLRARCALARSGLSSGPAHWS